MDYRQAIAKAKSRVQTEPVEMMREVMIAGGNEAIDNTTVLSGRLVSNWEMTRNRPNTNESNRFAPVRAAAKQRLIAALRSVKLGDVLYFTNPTPYAYWINYGKRANEPGQGHIWARFMVEKGFIKLKLAFKAAIAKRK